MGNIPLGHFYLLQSGEWFATPDSSGTVGFFIALGVIVIGVVIANRIRRGGASFSASTKGGKSSSGSSGSLGARGFSTFALHREIKNIDFTHEQVKMLDFVLRNDNAVDVKQSLNSSSTLDRHFRRAFKVIEKTAGNDNELQQKISLLFSTRNVLENSFGGTTVTNTRQIADHTDAVINNGKDNYPTKVISSRGDSLVVENPVNALGSPVRISRGSKVTISFFAKSSKGFSFSSRVLDAATSASGHPTLHLLHSNQVKMLSKRRFRRRQVESPAQFFFVHMEEPIKRKDKKRMVVDKRRLTGTILDISTGGCSMKTNAPVPAGTLLKIETNLGEREAEVAVLGQALRTNKTKMTTILHIKFVRVPRRSMNAINAEVYEFTDG